MSSYTEIVDFLPKDSQLLVMVKPSKDLAPELKAMLEKYREGIGRKFSNEEKYPVPLHLEETLKIKFSISKEWKIKKDLENCMCYTPALPDAKFDSLNSAYTGISKQFETHRKNPGGSVYPNLLFQSNDQEWLFLAQRREALFEPYKKDYEEKISVGKERTNTYLNVSTKTDELLKSILERKENIIKVLESTNKDQSLQIEELSKIISQSKIDVYKARLKEFEDRLKKDYPETSGDDSWQLWIYKNSWIFATQYTEPFPKERVGFNSIPDFLFPTLDGFIDILEIKKPTFKVLEEDKSHPGAYKWSKETNEAIGQVVNYLHELESHRQANIERIENTYEIRLSAVKSRGIILIGQSYNWSKKEHEALRKLNYFLHSIEVITYTDLLKRGERLVEIYEA